MKEHDRHPLAALGAEEDLASPSVEDPEITGLLQAWGSGDTTAGDELLRRLGDRLKRLAASFLRGERDGHTLQTTALVHEAYLRLIDQDTVRWKNRDHFLAVTGRMMRRVLVDHARRRSALKAGGQYQTFGDEALEHRSAPNQDAQLLALDEALHELERESPKLAAVVELRYFVGLNGDEIAESLGISRPTVQRRWKTARVWLHRYLQADTSHPAEDDPAKDDPA